MYFYFSEIEIMNTQYAKQLFKQLALKFAAIILLALSMDFAYKHLVN